MIRKIKVLMVDDEKQFRKTTEKILSKRGFIVLLADSGETAIEKLSEAPDVVVLDIKMPGMDGHETLKEIKQRHPDLPVIMLTGHGAMPSAKEALTEGAFDYLTKPCDIDILSSKIIDAYRHGGTVGEIKEKQVKDIMIPIEAYTTLMEENTVKEAILKLRETFFQQESTSKIMETGHRSLLVFDNEGNMKGLLTILDLLKAMMPGYLSAPKPSMADSIKYSPMFWRGMFTREVNLISQKKISEVMSPAPETISADANLMEAAERIVTKGRRRLAVMDEGKVVGVAREQDLFFEIERIIQLNQRP